VNVRIIAFIAALAWVAVAATGQAQPSYYDVCHPADLKGVWSLRSIRADEPGVQDFYRQHPVEYMRFGPGGKYDYVAGDAELTGLAAVNASLDRADRADGVTYQARIMDAGGKLIIFRDGKPFQGFMCVMQDQFMIWHELPGNPRLNRMHSPVR
jgi:hypothetical protein